MTVDGRLVRSATTAATLGSPYVFALQTSIAEPWLPVELYSVYIGAAHGPTHVTYLAHVPGKDPSLETVIGDSGAMPVPYARERMLLNHLQRLQDVLGGLGHTAAIEHGDGATLAVTT